MRVVVMTTAPAARHRAAGEPGPRPARDERPPVGDRSPHTRLHLGGGPGKQTTEVHPSSITDASRA